MSSGRYLLPILILAGTCPGQTPPGLSARLKVELKREYHYAPETQPAPEAPAAAVDPVDDEVITLEPFTSIAFNTFRDDVGKAAREAAATRDAAKFSPLKGGLIASGNFGPVEVKLGLWPKVVPFDPADPLAKAGVKLTVDVIRVTW